MAAKKENVPAKAAQTIDPITGEVIDAGLMAEMLAGSKQHQDNFTPDQIQIPRFTILQDMSDEIKVRDPKYIEGAKPGLIYNTVMGGLYESIVVTPAKFVERYIAWIPRNDGGGLVDPDIALEELQELERSGQFEMAGMGTWLGTMELEDNTGKKKVTNVEIRQTPEWAVIVDLPDGRRLPALIPFPGTKGKMARKLNSAIQFTELPGPNGPFRPPCYFHSFELGTFLDGKGENEYFNYEPRHLGLIAGDKDMVKRAKELREGIEAGLVKGEGEIVQE